MVTPRRERERRRTPRTAARRQTAEPRDREAEGPGAEDGAQEPASRRGPAGRRREDSEGNEQHAVAAARIEQRRRHGRHGAGVQSSPPEVGEARAEGEAEGHPARRGPLTARFPAQRQHGPECRREGERLAQVAHAHGRSAGARPRRTAVCATWSAAKNR
jgi:hypothetical protein